MPIQIEDQELAALVAVIMQGKFRPSRKDDTVPASPIVAALARRVTDAYAGRQLERFGELARAVRGEWQEFEAHPDEWAAAVDHARKFFAPNWDALPAERRLAVVDDLVAPFELTQSSRDRFIRAFLTPNDGASGIDKSKSLEQLEGKVWTHDEFPSHVVQESQRLRSVPVGELTVENLRLLLGQKIGAAFLVPLALDHLSSNPLAEGDYYRGDLLESVLRLPDEFWEAHPALNNDVVELAVEVAQARDRLTELVPALERFKYR
jgi:hypothetical protein